MIDFETKKPTFYWTYDKLSIYQQGERLDGRSVGRVRGK